MRKLKQIFKNRLANIYPEEEINELFFMVMEHILGKSKSQIIFAMMDNAEKETVETANDILCKLERHEPIQYILGKADFMGRTFKVNHSTLIPRPETALSVCNAIDEAKRVLESKPKVSIIDIGTGSGIIAISVALELGEKANVTAIDISDEALCIAKQNAKDLDANVKFLQVDVLSKDFFTLDKYDIIVSNPPYIRPSEMAEMRRNVLDYEPHLALFIPENDPLLFYREITNFATTHLENNGAVVFEINEAFGNETKEMMNKQGFRNVNITKDDYGKDRSIIARK